MDPEADASKKRSCRSSQARTHLATFRSIVPSPSKGIWVIFANLNPCSSSNFSSAEHAMLTNLLLEEGSCPSHKTAVNQHQRTKNLALACKRTHTTS